MLGCGETSPLGHSSPLGKRPRTSLRTGPLEPAGQTLRHWRLMAPCVCDETTVPHRMQPTYPPQCTVAWLSCTLKGMTSSASGPAPFALRGNSEMSLAQALLTTPAVAVFSLRASSRCCRKMRRRLARGTRRGPSPSSSPGPSSVGDPPSSSNPLAAACHSPPSGSSNPAGSTWPSPSSSGGSLPRVVLTASTSEPTSSTCVASVRFLSAPLQSTVVQKR